MNYRSCTVYLSRVRNAVRLAGRFEEQKTQEKMRNDMRKVLSAWLARYFDLSIFSVLTGTNPPFASLAGAELPYTIEAPTADYGNQVGVDDFKGYMWQFNDKLIINGKQFDGNILYD